MGTYRDRERFIPFRRRDIVEMLLAHGGLRTEEAKHNFRQFCELLQSILHFEFRKKLDLLKNAYFPFSPDQRCRRNHSPEELDAAATELFATMRSVLDCANFEDLSVANPGNAATGESTLKLKVLVEMDDFEEVRLFARGRYTVCAERDVLLGLRKRPIEYQALQRVVLMVRFKCREHFDRQERTHLPFTPGSTIVKLFKDVPRSDLMMLLPNSRAVMKTKDKLMLGVPAVAGGIPLLATKVLPAAITLFAIAGLYLGLDARVHENQLQELAAVLAGGLALGGFCVQQWMKYKNKLYEFQKDLSDNLYFRNLVNNEGVFHSIVDSAEEEDCKEAFLAYYFLLVTGRALTEPELDDLVEAWFEDSHGCTLDFEVNDALRKLERLDLLTRSPSGRLSVPPIREALRRLDYIWDNYFQYNQPLSDPQAGRGELTNDRIGRSA
ncbi:MAG: TMEM143 family protein [Thermodesulfobacteriota bacterium]